MTDDLYVKLPFDLGNPVTVDLHVKVPFDQNFNLCNHQSKPQAIVLLGFEFINE